MILDEYRELERKRNVLIMQTLEELYILIYLLILNRGLMYYCRDNNGRLIKEPVLSILDITQQLLSFLR